MALSLDRPYSLIEIIINIPLARLLAGGHGSSWPGAPVRCPRRHSRFLGPCGDASTGLGLAPLTRFGHRLCSATCEPSLILCGERAAVLVSCQSVTLPTVSDAHQPRRQCRGF